MPPLVYAIAETARKQLGIADLVDPRSHLLADPASEVSIEDYDALCAELAETFIGVSRHLDWQRVILMATAQHEHHRKEMGKEPDPKAPRVVLDFICGQCVLSCLLRSYE